MQKLPMKPLNDLGQSEAAIEGIPRVDPVNLHVVELMRDHLILKAYSKSTIKTYLNEMNQFLFRLGTIPADDLQPQHLKNTWSFVLRN